MSTGYTIQVGYMSGYSGRYTDEQAWEILRADAETICNTPALLAEEARKYGCPIAMGGDSLEEYARAFWERKDLTITFEQDSEGTPYIHMFASGGPPGRILKEHLRRAFVRLILHAAHTHGIELNITVS